MPKVAPSKDDLTERFRQIVIASRSNAELGSDADECMARLNELFAEDPTQFTAEDVRWVNVLRGTLAKRMVAHAPKKTYTPKAKRKGDKLDHCWRCETPVDERWEEICPTCDSKAYHWRTCPVCQACGCQREGKTLV